MTATGQHAPTWSEEEVPIEELARRKGVRPITSVEDLAQPGTFESDAELEEFLADLHAARHADLG